MQRIERRSTITQDDTCERELPLFFSADDEKKMCPHLRDQCPSRARFRWHERGGVRPGLRARANGSRGNSPRIREMQFGCKKARNQLVQRHGAGCKLKSGGVNWMPVTVRTWKEEPQWYSRPELPATDDTEASYCRRVYTSRLCEICENRLISITACMRVTVGNTRLSEREKIILGPRRQIRARGTSVSIANILSLPSEARRQQLAI